jgi:hypothetical protein
MLGFRIRYSGVSVLQELFREIFVNGIYMFKCDTDKPTIIDCGSNIGMSILFFKRARNTINPHPGISRSITVSAKRLSTFLPRGRSPQD